MTLFLVTRSDRYYPNEGVGDWIFVSADPTEARQRYANIERSYGQSKYLIQITETDWTVLDRAS